MDYKPSPHWTENEKRKLILDSTKILFQEIEWYICVYREELWNYISSECLDRHKKRIEAIEARSRIF